MTSKGSANGTTGTMRTRQHLLLRLVRGACEMLVTTEPWIAKTITVSGATEGNDSPHLVRKMTVRLAEEYGLNAEARVNGRTVVVRLSRHAAGVEDRREAAAAKAGAGLLTPDSTVV
ncbi:MAG: hypothetical protein ABR978_03415 [Dehalococcoidia bacterium]